MKGIARYPSAAALMFAVGATSAQAGTIPISLTILPLAQISGLSDVTFSNVSAQSDAVSTQSVCTYSNSLTRSYTVTASGDGAGSAFTLAATGGGTVPYSVGWGDSAASASTTTLTAGAASVAFGGAAILPTCTLGGPATSTLKITIGATDLQGMVGGLSYTGTLTLVITPT
jgi:hypothetical protein